MKKSILSLLLAVVLTFGATQSVISAFAETKRNEETPIAQIENDDYVPYDYAKKAISNYTEEEAISNITREVKSVGGYVETYASEDEYLNSQNKTTTANTVDAHNSQTESIKQTIRVMTTATGSETHSNYVESEPIANAIVRINGVPRYTDRAGKINVSLIKGDYVELFVEKDGYNPYIEILDVIGDEKVVYLKQPSDDIDIYSVMFSLDGQSSNVLLQDFHVNKNIDTDYYAELAVGCNVIADEYNIYVNGELKFYSDENVFYGMQFDDIKPNDKFTLQVVYQGIESKIVDLRIKVSDGTSGSTTPKPTSDEKDTLYAENDYGIFSGLTLDLTKVINEIMEMKPSSGVFNASIPLSVDYDRRKGTFTIYVGITVGAHFNKTPTGSDKRSDEERYKDAKQSIKNYNNEVKECNDEIKRLTKEINSNNQTINALSPKDPKRQKAEQANKNLKNQVKNHNNSKKNSSKSLTKPLNDMNTAVKNAKTTKKTREERIQEATDALNANKISKADYEKKLASIPDIKQRKKAYTQHNRSFGIDIEISGVFEFNLLDKKIEKMSITIGANLWAKFDGTFMAGYIPMFYEVKVSIGAKVTFYTYYKEKGDINFDELLKWMKLETNAGLRGELGVGFNDILSASLFAELEFGTSLYPFATDQNGVSYWDNQKDYKGESLEFNIGIHVEVLFWDWEFGKGAYHHTDETRPDKHLENEKSIKLMARSTFDIDRYSADDTVASSNIFGNVYQGSKPQLNKVGDKYILTWIEDSSSRDDFNRTILKYAVYDNGIWSESYSVHDDGKADFYQNTYVDGDDFYITWQKSNRIFNENDDYITMGSAADIAVAKYDVSSNTFKTQIIKNDGMDAAPKFVLKETETDPLSIVWQRNTENDILGLTGINSIWCSTLDNNTWSEARQLYQSENYFSYVCGAYSNSELVVAFSENNTGDYLNLSDYNVKICGDGMLLTVSADGEKVANPQFCVCNGKVKLFYSSNDNLVFTEDFKNVFTFNSLNEKDIPDSFKIVSTDTGYAFFYSKVEGDKIQSFCTLYDDNTSDWTYNVLLTNETLDTYDTIGLVTEENYIFAAYNLRDAEGNASMGFVEKQIVPDFEIQNVFFNTDISKGDNFTLSIGILNTGDVNLNNFEIAAFGQTCIKNSSVPVGEYVFIDVNLAFQVSEAIEEIIVISNGIERHFSLPVIFSDINIAGEVYLQSEKQIFDISINNVAEISENVTLNVYKGGEIIYTEQIMSKANTITKKQLQFNDLNEGDKLYFEIITSDSDRLQCDNNFTLTSIKDTHIIEHMENPYGSIIKSAKELIF